VIPKIENVEKKVEQGTGRITADLSGSVLGIDLLSETVPECILVAPGYPFA